MASIVKRKKKYSVVYSYTDENGKEHKKWETFESNAEAKHRKAEIELKGQRDAQRPVREDGPRAARGLYVHLRREYLGDVHI